MTDPRLTKLKFAGLYAEKFFEMPFEELEGWVNTPELPTHLLTYALEAYGQKCTPEQALALAERFFWHPKVHVREGAVCALEWHTSHPGVVQVLREQMDRETSLVVREIIQETLAEVI